MLRAVTSVSEISECMDELAKVIDTIQSIDGDLALEVVEFIRDKIIEEDIYDTYRLALQYANWAMSKNHIATRRTLAHGKCNVCYKGTKWIKQDDGTFTPCDSCAVNRIDKWQREFIDSNQDPY